MTSAVLGSLTEFRLGDGGGPETFTKVAEVLSIGPVGATAPEVDVTNLDSTSKEYIGGLPDGQQVEISGNWIAASTEQAELRDNVGNTRNIQIVWPDSTQADFAFVILGFNMDETSAETQIKFSVSGRISGDITWT